MALRDTLKDATRDAHTSLEAFLALDRPGLTLQSYREYLRLTHAFYAGVEPQLCASPALAAMGIDMAPRAKRGWLREDLDFFGIAPLEPPEAAPGGLAEPARALGCAYVLEGATLGGLVLQGMLAPRFGVGPGRGATFLSGYGARTAAMWRSFIADLEDAGRRGIEEDACVAGARDTFVQLGDWFRRGGWASK